eukprot:6173445-Pleurochrysis_carterae.AAC.6
MRSAYTWALLLEDARVPTDVRSALAHAVLPCVRFRRDASDVAWHEQIVRESQPEGDVGEGERPPLKLRVAALI